MEGVFSFAEIDVGWVKDRVMILRTVFSWKLIKWQSVGQFLQRGWTIMRQSIYHRMALKHHLSRLGAMTEPRRPSWMSIPRCRASGVITDSFVSLCFPRRREWGWGTTYSLLVLPSKRTSSWRNKWRVKLLSRVTWSRAYKNWRRTSIRYQTTRCIR